MDVLLSSQDCPFLQSVGNDYKVCIRHDRRTEKSMTVCVRYLTHPQVNVNPDVPVTQWGLTVEGRARARTMAEAPWLLGTTKIVSSGERKALETAELLAAELNIKLERREAMHENDRASTGFLSPDEFEVVADQFFQHPTESVRGWERAIDAQQRIVREAEEVLARGPMGDVLFVGHGAVGTLLFCYYAGVSIDRVYDQPTGGGHYFGLIMEGRRVLHPWRRMEEPPPD